MFLMLQGFGQHLTLLSRKVNKLKMCSKRPNVNKYLNMVLIILLGVSFLFAGPTVLFMYVEGWTLMEGLYYCFVTLSTIGFGDYITGECQLSASVGKLCLGTFRCCSTLPRYMHLNLKHEMLRGVWFICLYGR